MPRHDTRVASGGLEDATDYLLRRLVKVDLHVSPIATLGSSVDLINRTFGADVMTQARGTAAQALVDSSIVAASLVCQQSCLLDTLLGQVEDLVA